MFRRSMIALVFVSAALGPNPHAADSPAPKPANADAPFARDWPDATLPGKVEIKRYPPYRSAVARAKNASMGADNIMFFSLFRHISRSNVEMTSPVVNTYEPKMIESPKALGDVSMEFLYASPEVGTTGKGVGAVEVVDHPAATYVCLGVQGKMNDELMRDGISKLRKWLEEHKGEWTEDGPPRRLGYHGPMTPVAQRLWEVQLPVKAVEGGRDSKPAK